MFEQRPISVDDLDDVAALLTRARPDDPVDVVNFRHRDAAWDHTRLWRDRLGVWDRSGVLRAVVTAAHLRWEFHPDRYEVQLVVDPAVRRMGIGGALHDWAIALLMRREAVSVRAEVPETDAVSQEWAQRRGYVEVGRAWEGRLSVAHAHVEALAPGCSRAVAAGVRVTTLAALFEEAARYASRSQDPLDTRDAIEAALFDLDVEATADIPSVDPIVHPPFEAWRASVLRVPGFVEGAVLVAVAGDALVGVAYLEARASTPGVLHQGFLGVRRAWRGRGVAQLLKRATVEVAAARGVSEVRTFNDAGNAAMVHINDVVGFARSTSWITVVRALGK